MDSQRHEIEMPVDPGPGPDPYEQALLRMIPKVGPVAAQLREELHERERRRYEQFRDELAHELELDDLAQAILEHERFGDMLREAVDAAVRTHDESKIRLLAKTFASGALAEDEAAIDEAQQLLRLVAELDPVDLRAMLSLRDHARGYGHPVACVQHELSLRPSTASMIYARLERMGLIEVERSASMEGTTYEGGEIDLQESWGLSDGATALLEFLDELQG